MVLMSRVELTKETGELVKKVAAKKGISIASYVNNLIDQVGVADKGVKVILTVPSDLIKKNKAGLEEWLKVRMDALVKVYYS